MHHTYKPIRIKWTPIEQRVFTLLTMRRWNELAELCKRIAENDATADKQTIWR